MDEKYFYLGAVIFFIILATSAAVFAAGFIVWYQLKQDKDLIPTTPLLKSFLICLIVGIGLSAVLLISSTAGYILWEIVGSSQISFEDTFHKLMPAAFIFAVDFSLTLFATAQISKSTLQNKLKFSSIFFLVGFSNVLAGSISFLAVLGWDLEIFTFFLTHLPQLFLSLLAHSLNPIILVQNSIDVFTSSNGNAFDIVSGCISPILMFISFCTFLIHLLHKSLNGLRS